MNVDIDGLPPWANDAVPLNSIGLSRVFRMVANALASRPDLPITTDPVLLGILETDIERKTGISFSDYARLTPEPYVEDMKANVFFRGRLSRGELVALVRDPGTGETLKLPPGSWIPWRWIETGHIEPGIFFDHVHIDEPHNPGPSGTLIRGEIRPVFFHQEEFGLWYQSVFGEVLNLIEGTSAALTRVAAPEVRPTTPDHRANVTARRRVAIKLALDKLYGVDGPPVGLSANERDRAINEWLAKNGRSKVSEATIRRALSELRNGTADRD